MDGGHIFEVNSTLDIVRLVRIICPRHGDGSSGGLLIAHISDLNDDGKQTPVIAIYGRRRFDGALSALPTTVNFRCGRCRRTEGFPRSQLAAEAEAARVEGRQRTIRM